MKRLNMFGHERNRHHQHFFDAFAPKPLDRFRQRRLQPFRRADAALVTKQMCPRPLGVLLRSQFAYRAHGGFDLLGVWIARFHEEHRQPLPCATPAPLRLSADASSASRSPLPARRAATPPAPRPGAAVPSVLQSASVRRSPRTSLPPESTVAKKSILQSAAATIPAAPRE